MTSNSLAHYAKGTRSVHILLYFPPTVCKHTVSGSISLPSKGCFSPFPHGTGSLSVTVEYLALEGGPPGFKQDFSCPALLRILLPHIRFRLQGSHLLWRTFPNASATVYANVCSPTTPIAVALGLGSSPFARHY